MAKLKIGLFTVCRNELELISHFLEYYSSFVSHIYIFDNNSNDGTRDIIENQVNVTVIPYDTKGLLRDDLHMLIKNSCWQEFRKEYDWVIITDLDEFLFHDNLELYLNQAIEKKYTILNTCGFNMISDTYPTADEPLLNQIKNGAFSTNFSKPIIFDPKAIEQINYSPGGHFIEPIGNVKIKDSDGLLLLHLKYLGGLSRLQRRWDKVGEELSSVNEKYGWGIKRKIPEVIQKRYKYVNDNKVNVFKCDTRDYINHDRTLI